MIESAVVLENVDVDRAETPVLRQMSFSVRVGETVSILGVSGCGKSTLLLAIAGILPCSGRRVVTGQVGIVFQSYAVFPWLSVRGNLGFGLTALSVAARRAKVDRLIDRIGLRAEADRYPHELSGGQQQRVAIARSLAVDPQILLLDEPFGALDAVTRESMQEWFAQLRSERPSLATVLVTHSIDEALTLSHRVAVIRRGFIAAEVELAEPGSSAREALDPKRALELRAHLRAALHD